MAGAPLEPFETGVPAAVFASIARMGACHAIRVLATAALLSGCVARGALRGELPALDPPWSKAAASVVLLRQPGPPERLLHRELPWTSVEIDLAAYPASVASMLGEAYSAVSVATSAEQARGADYVVRMSTDYPRTVGLSFEDSAGRRLAEFSRPGLAVADAPEASSPIAKLLTPPAMVVSFGALALVFASRVYAARDRIRDDLSAATARALATLRAQILAARELRVAGASPQPLPPEPAPKPAPPPPPFPAVAPRPACAAPLAAAEVPPAARELLERGQTYLRLAISPEDYRAAAAELGKASAAAPCWASPLLSAAMAEEGARRWRAAAARLRAYLELGAGASEAAGLRVRIGELESRPGDAASGGRTGGQP